MLTLLIFFSLSYFSKSILDSASLSISSSYSLVGKKNVKRKPRKHIAIIIIIGIGSFISLTNGTPIVKNFETKIMMFTAVAFLEKGNNLSS